MGFSCFSGEVELKERITIKDNYGIEKSAEGLKCRVLTEVPFTRSQLQTQRNPIPQRQNGREELRHRVQLLVEFLDCTRCGS